jgi:tRNA-dihydrouridine synthase B
MENILDKLKSKVVAAPMAATTNIPFRKICQEFGAALTFSGMVNSDMLIKDCTHTLRLAVFDEIERPIALQLFGHNAYHLADAAKALETLRPDIIDINAGCPVQKITRFGSGSALLKDLNKFGNVVRTVVDAVKTPVSVKIRTGYTNKIIACEAAKIAEDCGAAFITVHARTRLTPYSEPPNWEWIKQVKNSVKIPVIGNGDVFYAPDAYNMLDETGCDYVLIARGALGNPWLFRDSIHYINTREILPPVTYEERLALILRHCDMSLKEHGEILAFKEMKRHVSWYTRGFPDVEEFRYSIFKAPSYNDMITIIESYFEKLEKGIWTIPANPESEDKKFRDRVVFWLVDEDTGELVGG